MWNIIRTLAENLMGDDWVTEGERIMRKFGWSSIPKMCLASAPRRFGKTVAVATAASGYAILMEDKVQAVFSTGGRASGGMRDYVRKAIVGIGLEDLIQTRGKSSENMYIKTIFDDIYNTSESTIKFLPSDPKVSQITLLLAIFFFVVALVGILDAIRWTFVYGEKKIRYVFLLLIKKKGGVW
jgi:hypothetical protein